MFKTKVGQCLNHVLLYSKGRNTRSFSWCDITESGFLSSLIYCQGGIFPSHAPINWLALNYWKTWGRSFSWQQPRHLVERGAFHWQHGSGYWSIFVYECVVAPSQQTLWSQHWTIPPHGGDSRAQDACSCFEGRRKECDPNEECWSSNFVHGCGHSFSFSFLMRRCWVRPTCPPPHTHTHTHFGWKLCECVCEPHIELHHQGVDSRQDVDRRLFGNKMKNESNPIECESGGGIVDEAKGNKCKGCEWLIRTFSLIYIYIYIYVVCYLSLCA